MTITLKHTNTGQLQYSINKNNWTNIVKNDTTTSSKVIYFRGKMNSARLFTETNTNNSWEFNNASNLSISGNLNTLLNYENPPTTILDYCYSYMFYQCTSLTDISELILPATTLGLHCYYSMFQYCTSLTSIPSDLLPATILKDYCYSKMFNYCNSLVVNKAISTGYSRPFRIPSSGTGTTASHAIDNMFSNTKGSMSGNPLINTTYYIKD